MSARPDEIAARIASLRTLRAVIAAMRGMAAARARQAEGRIVAIDRYAATVAAALDRAAALLPGPPPAPGGAAIVVAFLAQQGFAGGFSGHVLDALQPADARVVLLGTRGLGLAAERGLSPWQGLALPTLPEALPRLADTLSRRLLAEPVSRIDVLHATAGAGGAEGVERRRVYPIPIQPETSRPAPPLLNLPPVQVLAALLEEALQAGLLRAAFHSFAAENMARMAAMGAAERQAERMLGRLEASERQVRQEAITAEIVELGAGVAARRSAPAPAGS